MLQCNSFSFLIRFKSFTMEDMSFFFFFWLINCIIIIAALLLSIVYNSCTAYWMNIALWLVLNFVESLFMTIFFTENGDIRKLFLAKCHKMQLFTSQNDNSPISKFYLTSKQHHVLVDMCFINEIDIENALYAFQ